LKIELSQTEASIKLAGKSTSKPGLYRITFSHSSTSFSKIPPLNVLLLDEVCTLSVSGTYLIPDGGYSLPIAIDFGSCVPANDLTLTLEPKEPCVNISAPTCTNGYEASSRFSIPSGSS